ncbi:GNAT family N-acetyltransferase [Kineococcus glutinatus]|uniref:GNAT family N-acetyltransferase n=1 Tax=Kineococcus glutinatus TaxID=1070872 RepID=UPI003CD08D3C
MPVARTTPAGLRIAAEPWDGPDGTALRAAQRAELEARYGADIEPGARPTADDVAVFLLARDGTGRALGCGALRPLGAGRAELKRMYVDPDARGTGVAAALLRALEDAARQRGVHELLLETGVLQPDAMRFYAREGYAPVPPFGPYVDEPTSRCYARTL